MRRTGLAVLLCAWLAAALAGCGAEEEVQVEGVIIERDSISRIEIGTRFVPDYELLVFAQVLGVSVPWLLGMSE